MKLSSWKNFFSIGFLMIMGCEPQSQSDFNVDERSRILANELSDLDLLQESLNAIEYFHEQNSTGLVFNPPAAKEDIEQAEAAFNCTLPDELKYFWSWRNGESTDKFIWYHKFLSIHDSIKECNDLISADYSLWKKDWIPIFEFQGELYGVECSRLNAKASPIIYYFVESGERIAYINLTRYMQFIAKAIDDNVLIWNEDWWDDDLKRFAEIYALYNPGLQFPYYVPK